MPEFSSRELLSRQLSHGLLKPSPDPAPRVKGGFSCRASGSMKSPEARLAVLECHGLGGRPLFLLRQVHGTSVVALRGDIPAAEAPQADGWLTERPGVVLGVYVADCAPIYVWERSGKAVGVFHAGWRGLAKGMPARAVEAFREEFGIATEALEASVGPHIGACCYNVGPETAEQFPPESLVKRDGKTYLDLTQHALRALIAAGVRRPLAFGGCTSCDREIYFSYRREKSDNRMMAFITIDG